MPPRKRKPRPHPNPPRELAKRELPLQISQNPWLRIYRLGLDAIFFGTSGDNRFDAPGGEFGVLYVAQDMFGAFVETLGHKTGTRLIALADLQARGLAQINVARPLKLVDLTGSGLAQVGADNELVSGPPEVAQRWSLAFHKHPDQPDGRLYRQGAARGHAGFFVHGGAMHATWDADA